MYVSCSLVYEQARELQQEDPDSVRGLERVLGVDDFQDEGGDDGPDDDDDASDKMKRPVNRHNRHKVTVSFHAPLTLAISLHADDGRMMLLRV